MLQALISECQYTGNWQYKFRTRVGVTRQIINIGPVLKLLRVHRAKIVSHMGIHWTGFYYLSSSNDAFIFS